LRCHLGGTLGEFIVGVDRLQGSGLAANVAELGVGVVARQVEVELQARDLSDACRDRPR
jgi:hypothetical protein